MELCPTFGKTCNHCHKPNHFAVKCRQKPRPTSVTTVEEQDSEDETYYASTLSQDLDDAQLVAKNLESGNFPRFQVDTGAQCNVIPVDLYIRAAQDPSLKRVTKSTGNIVVYGGSTIPVVGSVTLASARERQSIRSTASWSKGTKFDHSLDGRPV